MLTVLFDEITAALSDIEIERFKLRYAELREEEGDEMSAARHAYSDVMILSEHEDREAELFLAEMIR